MIISTLVPAAPGYFVVYESGMTGELKKGEPVIAWDISQSDTGTDMLHVSIITPMGRNRAGEMILFPDGRVSFPESYWASLDEANTPEECARRKAARLSGATP